MSTIRKLIFIAAALWSFWSERSHGAEITYSTLGGQTVVTLSGSLEHGDDIRFMDVVTHLEARGRHVGRLRLNSRGGLVSVGLEIADWVRGLDMTTEVRDGDECASACFLLFAGGVKRVAGYGARIGVHNASNDGLIDAVADAATMRMVRRLNDLRVPSHISGRLVSTAPSDMAWLTTDELRSMGVVLDSPPAPKPVEAPRPLAFQPVAAPRAAAKLAVKPAPSKPKPTEEAPLEAERTQAQAKYDHQFNPSRFTNFQKNALKDFGINIR